MELDEALVAGHLQELRRGSVVLACLSVLRTPHYGYSLLSTLADGGLPVDANTLYPLLRRLEKQGLLRSEWNTEDARPRKFYEVSGVGLALLERLDAEWADLNRSIRRFVREGTP